VADEVFIHLGLPKTGTTYLQTILWGARDQLRAEGLLLPGHERRDHLWASREVRDDPHLHRLPARASTAWRRLRDEIAAWPGRALVSHEFFAAASAEQAARMVAELQPARVHLVATAREPLGLFAASWQESLKNRGTTPMDRYSRTVSANPLDVWNWRTLDLRLVLERWAPAVPPDRVHVLPLDTGAPHDDLWHRFGGLLGLDTGAYDLSMSFPNESMGVVEAETMRRINQQLDSGDLPHPFVRAFDRGVYLRTFLADERLVPRKGERFWPREDRIAECRERGAAAVAHVRAQGYDVRGDLERLLVPDELPARRTPDSVTDAEVADAATWLVARMLADVRELREGRPDGGAAEPTADPAAPVSRRRGWWRGR